MGAVNDKGKVLPFQKSEQQMLDGGSYKEVLTRFSYEDEEEIRNRIFNTSKDNYRENKDIINEIVLWKVNRRPHIGTEIIDAIYKLKTIEGPLEAVDNDLTPLVIKTLLHIKGVRLPMASTILHFYYPEVFPIIDQRAYRELYGTEYPRAVLNTDTFAELYMKYILDCYSYQQNKCPDIPFEKIDKILYQLDKEKGYKVKY